MRGQRERTQGISARVGLQALRAVAAAVLVFVVARAAYYPFWAAGADQDALSRSWGGPSVVGATLAHWAVAALIGTVCAGVLIVSTRLLHART